MGAGALVAPVAAVAGINGCPLCGHWDGQHAPGCVVGDLQDLGRAGRAAHHRALLLVVLQAHAGPMTMREAGDAMRICEFDVGKVAEGLMKEGLVFPDFGHYGQPPTVCLTSAPHVAGECARAADLLGMVLGQPGAVLSPVLRRPW